MKIYEKISEPIGYVKEDIWSDWRDSFYDSVGIDAKTREELNPVIKDVKSLLPKGGAVVEQGPGNYSKPQATGFAFQSNANPYLVIGSIALGGLALYYLLK